jgi:hypothetical protein
MLKRVALVSALALAGLPVGGDEKRPARVYTNEDLERVAPRRGETGVLSRPGTPPSPRELGVTGARTRGEEYWRREAARVRARVRTLQDQAARVRDQIEREATRGSTGKRRRAWVRDTWAAEEARARRLRDIEARVRDLESDLEDRARRDGALPGWLR